MWARARGSRGRGWPGGASRVGTERGGAARGGVDRPREARHTLNAVCHGGQPRRGGRFKRPRQHSRLVLVGARALAVALQKKSFFRDWKQVIAVQGWAPTTLCQRFQVGPPGYGTVTPTSAHETGDGLASTWAALARYFGADLNAAAPLGAGRRRQTPCVERGALACRPPSASRAARSSIFHVYTLLQFV